MKKSQLIATAIFLISLTVFAEKNQEDEINWAYTGNAGAEHWGDLSPSFSLCKTGKNQSPVNISNDVVEVDLPSINFKYSMLTPENIVNTGNSIQVNMWSGGEITVDNKIFELKQFHFHTPSEHTIGGKHAPLEAQFEHFSETGEKVVVAMMFEPGEADRTLSSLVKAMPMETGDKNKLDSKALENMDSEFSTDNYFRYNGSLTIPPCTEGIRWIVMKKPMTISNLQLEAFQKALKRPNARPVQALNGRVVAQ